MSYFVIQPAEEAVFVTERPALAGRREIAFDTGAKLTEPVPPFDLVVSDDNEGAVLDFVPATTPGFAISTRFRQALESAGVGNVDYYPIRIIDQRTGTTHGGYFEANVLDLIACMDRARSRYTARAALPNRIRSIEELHLDESRIGEAMLFRLAERSTLLIAHDRVRQAAEAAGVRGVRFEPAAGFAT